MKLKMKWHDETATEHGGIRSRRTTHSVIVPVDSTHAPSLHITVVYDHVYHPDAYCFHCDELNIQESGLSASTMEEAKVEALELVFKRLVAWFKAVCAATGTPIVPS